MEILNVTHSINLEDELLQFNLKDHQELVAQVEFRRDILNLEQADDKFPSLESIQSMLYSKQDPYFQTIIITSFTDQDSYTATAQEIEKSHEENLKKIKQFLKSIIKIEPTYTQEEDSKSAETMIEYSARLITETNIIASMINYLNSQKIRIEEEVPIIIENMHKL